MIKKSLLSSRALTLLVGFGVLTLLPIYGAERGPYFTGGIGGSIAEDVDLKEFNGPVGGAEVKLDPGFHLGVAGGYNFNRWIGVEMETGILANNISKIGNSSPDATLSHVPFLANVVLRYEDERSLLVPYLSIGGGGDSSVLFIDNSLGVDGSDSDLVYAVQATAGVRLKIGDKMSAGVGYKFYHTGSPSWEIENSSGEISFGEATVHAFFAVFNMTF